MEGPLIVLALGLAALVAAALRDRHTREVALAAAPARPGMEDAPTPSYVTPPDADRPREVPELTDDQLAAWQRVRDRGERFDVRLADQRFATSPGRLGLADAMVLATADPITSIRELLPACNVAIAAKRPLVVAAPEVEASVATTLVVNLYRNTLTAAWLTGPAGACEHLVQATGGRLVTHAELQSGLAPQGFAGTAARIVADADGCSVEAVSEA